MQYETRLCLIDYCNDKVTKQKGSLEDNQSICDALCLAKPDETKQESNLRFVKYMRRGDKLYGCMDVSMYLCMLYRYICNNLNYYSSSSCSLELPSTYDGTSLAPLLIRAM